VSALPFSWPFRILTAGEVSIVEDEDKPPTTVTGVVLTGTRESVRAVAAAMGTEVRVVTDVEPSGSPVDDGPTPKDLFESMQHQARLLFDELLDAHGDRELLADTLARWAAEPRHFSEHGSLFDPAQLSRLAAELWVVNDAAKRAPR
jgi:hypothetical protein